MSKYQYRPPCRELSGYVQYYWMLDLEDVCPSCEPHRLTPQGFMEIVFLLSGFVQAYSVRWRRNSSPGDTLRAANRIYRCFYPRVGCGADVGCVYPCGVQDILHLPLNELTNRYVSLEEVLGREGKDMEGSK